MPVSSFVFYFIAEMLAVVVIICFFLIFHVRGLRSLISALESKVTSLRLMIKNTRSEARQAVANLEKIRQQKPKGYLEFLDEQIERTRTHHEELNPDRDIVLDIDTESPIDRQVASLRHAFLIAEQESMYAGGDDHNVDWDVIESKLGQLIQFYKINIDIPVADTGPQNDYVDIDKLHQRISHLEEFKKLYFDLQKKWDEITDGADDYHQRLLVMGKGMGADAGFEELLGDYAKHFNSFSIKSGDDEISNDYAKPQYGTVEMDPTKPTVGQLVIANQEEVQRLRNMAIDQHKLIQELKRKLAGANTVEQKDAIIEEMSHQMERQERFLRESETCSKLMEAEMGRLFEENQQLRNSLQDVGADTEEIQRMEGIISDLTNASQDMLAAISSLEQENREIKSNAPVGDDPALKEKLASTQQKLLDLEAQHLELEERYLDLKRKTK
jgi:translation initiation factor 1 (eIF-1/SUI1)